MIRSRECLTGRNLMMGKQLEPWEGYCGPPVPEGTDASESRSSGALQSGGITTLASTVRIAQEVRVQDLEWGYWGAQP